MKIKVLGACCDACNRTFINVKQAAAEIDQNIEVEQTSSVVELLRYGSIKTPLVVVENRLVSDGVESNFEQAKALIINNVDR